MFFEDYAAGEPYLPKDFSGGNFNTATTPPTPADIGYPTAVDRVYIVENPNAAASLVTGNPAGRQTILDLKLPLNTTGLIA